LRRIILISRNALEGQLLERLQKKVMQPDVVEYIFARFEE